MTFSSLVRKISLRPASSVGSRQNSVLKTKSQSCSVLLWLRMAGFKIRRPSTMKKVSSSVHIFDIVSIVGLEQVGDPPQLLQDRVEEDKVQLILRVLVHLRQGAGLVAPLLLVGHFDVSPNVLRDVLRTAQSCSLLFPLLFPNPDFCLIDGLCSACRVTHLPFRSFPCTGLPFFLPMMTTPSLIGTQEWHSLLLLQFVRP